jgi:fermentation-respiration switch protein FrsA (DUF1100 family)
MSVAIMTRSPALGSFCDKITLPHLANIVRRSISLLARSANSLRPLDRRKGRHERQPRRRSGVDLPVGRARARRFVTRRRLSATLATFFAINPGAATEGGQGFYRAAAQEIAGRPGTVIRHEPIWLGPIAADAYRVLYRSTGLNGEPIAVSGVVVIPEGPVPPGGRPIVAWAHPTTGVVSSCAPSGALSLFLQIPGLWDMVHHGYIVAATDYPGLGTLGPHPYLVGTSEGRAVLDAVRAARNLAGAGAGNRVALWGHSQGGQAALYAGLIAKRYAPELNIVGVAAAAPATNLRKLLRKDFSTVRGKNLVAITLWSWARVYGAPVKDVIDPAAAPMIDSVANSCLVSPLDLLSRYMSGEALEQRFLTTEDLTHVEPWRSLLASNTVGPLPPTTPIFLAQGAADDTVAPSVTRNYMKQLCTGGSAVRMLTLPNVGHIWIGYDSAAKAVQWVAERFAGTPAPTDCVLSTASHDRHGVKLSRV